MKEFIERSIPNPRQALKAIFLGVFLLGGLSIVSAYTAPSGLTAPNNGTFLAPFHSGSADQSKAGGLAIQGSLSVGNTAGVFTQIISGGIFANAVRSTSLQISGHPGCEPGAGKILVSDASGKGCWTSQ